MQAIGMKSDQRSVLIAVLRGKHVVFFELRATNA